MDSVEEIKIESQIGSTSDADLVELSGYHAYKNYEKGNIEEGVNGKEFRVIHVEKNRKSGFKALTVENIETGEYTIVYVGSQDFVKDWVLTNPMLLGDTPPQ